MTLHQLQAQALELSTEERWALTDALLRSLKPQNPPSPKPQGIVASLIGIAKTDGPAPTDDEVAVMLDERLAQKHGSTGSPVAGPRCGCLKSQFCWLTRVITLDAVTLHGRSGRPILSQ
jgi:hypothetical protein